MKVIGIFKQEGVFHGSQDHFLSFEQSRLKSLGFHFGDILQAQYFAKGTGNIIKADLSFQNLIDIGDQDWGWTSARHIALAFYTSCVFGGIPVAQEDFYSILGPMPWSNLNKTNELSADEQFLLVELFRSYDCDGIRYVNKFVPPDRPGGTAYFVLNPDQIEIVNS